MEEGEDEAGIAHDEDGPPVPLHKLMLPHEFADIVGEEEDESGKTEEKRELVLTGGEESENVEPDEDEEDERVEEHRDEDDEGGPADEGLEVEHPPQFVLEDAAYGMKPKEAEGEKSENGEEVYEERGTFPRNVYNVHEDRGGDGRDGSEDYQRLSHNPIIPNMKALLIIIVIALIGWGVYALTQKSGNETPNPEPAQEQSAENSGTTDTGTQLAVREFTVHGKPFSFSPSTLTVNKGEKVRITFVNDEGTHDLVVDGYNVRTNTIQAGQSETIEFIADKEGSFEYYCSVGSHRQLGMRGTLVVNP